MTKAELITAIAEKGGYTKKDAEKALSSVVDVISDALVNGDKITLVGFGTFETRQRAAKVGKNPQTGKEIKIAAKKVPAFKAGKALKDAVNK